MSCVAGLPDRVFAGGHPSMLRVYRECQLLDGHSDRAYGGLGPILPHHEAPPRLQRRRARHVAAADDRGASFRGQGEFAAPMITIPAVDSAAIEAKTIRKVRARVIPLVFILFVIAVLDRNNIGFAALTMNKELGITSQQYGFVAGIFFFGYFIFEIPSNLILHRIGARIWIARILITWGIVT